jgi:hypothetical protein
MPSSRPETTGHVRLNPSPNSSSNDLFVDVVVGRFVSRFAESRVVASPNIASCVSRGGSNCQVVLALRLNIDFITCVDSSRREL